MTATTLNARTQATSGRLARLRVALAESARQGATMVSAARHRYRRPALTISGFACMDASAFQGGLWLGLLTTGISALVYEWLGGEDR
jgi:hypothetical protein